MSQNLNELLEIRPSLESSETESTDETPPSIGGWLILPSIGLVLGIIIGIVGIIFALSLAQDLPSRYLEVFFLGIVAEVGILIFVIYAATRFFGKRQNAPTTMIALYITAIVVHGVLLLVELAADAEPFAIESAKVLIRNIVGAAIWIPYFRISKRVKKTFIVP